MHLLVTVFYFFFLVKTKRIFNPGKPAQAEKYAPEVSLVVSCYNEAPIIRDKIRNSLQLVYDPGLIKIYFITDGSDDYFRDVLGQFPQINLLHEDRRAGKTAAENRSMRYITSPIEIFTDANTLLNKLAVKNMVRHLKMKSRAAYQEKNGC